MDLLRELRAWVRGRATSPLSAAPPIEPPPLRRWQSVWRYAAAVVIGAAAWLSVAEAQAEHAELLFFVDPFVGLVALVLIRFRRRWPLSVALVAAATSAVSTFAAGPAVVVVVSLSTRRRWREIAPVAAVLILGAYLYTFVQPRQTGSAVTGVAFAAVATAVLVATGMYIGARRDLVASLHDRAERAEREQAMRVDQAQANERARIAREMHDVLAHRISRIAMHAGALAYRSAPDPADARQAAEVIRTDAHAALTELRSVLGVLRQPGSPAETPGAPERPQPTLADLDALVEQARAGGMNVTVDRGDPPEPPLSDQVGRNAYRIVQEGLTNAAKHAPGAHVRVRLRRTADEFAVEVRNPLPFRTPNGPPGSGFGLIGLTERTTLAGGRFEHGAAGGEFLMRAWLPCEPVP